MLAGQRAMLLVLQHCDAAVLSPCPPPRTQGSLPNLFKLAPAAGISWFVFEETKMLLGVDVRS